MLPGIVSEEVKVANGLKFSISGLENKVIVLDGLEAPYSVEEEKKMVLGKCKAPRTGLAISQRKQATS